MARSEKSIFRKTSNWLHLWLGLISGVVVFVVCFTAAIWVFRDEITLTFTPGQYVKAENRSQLKPSELYQKARLSVKNIPNDGIGGLYSIDYREKGKSAILSYRDGPEGDFHDLYLNPYNGEILYHRINTDSVIEFNDFLRAGHRFFWLPRPFGSYFVGSSCIFFLITLITGLIWWYPKKWNKSTRDKSFKIKWTAKSKRLNIDLHNVLGFYTLIFTIILTVTGIVFTFRWFDDGYYWLLSGGKPKMEYPNKGISDTTIVSSQFVRADDELYIRYGKNDNLRISYPKESKDVYKVYLNPTSGHNDLTEWYSFDQNSLKIVGGNTNMNQYSLGQKIYRANFDIHVGTIGGLTTKIIASIASLVGASLPITGFIIWYNRKWGKKKAKKTCNRNSS